MTVLYFSTLHAVFINNTMQINVTYARKNDKSNKYIYDSLQNIFSQHFEKEQNLQKSMCDISCHTGRNENGLNRQLLIKMATCCKTLFAVQSAMSNTLKPLKVKPRIQ